MPTESLSIFTTLLPFAVLAVILWLLFRRRGSNKPEIVENPFDVRFVWEEDQPVLSINNKSKDPVHQVTSQLQVRDRSFSPLFWRSSWIDYDRKEWAIVTPNWSRTHPIDFDDLADFMRKHNLATPSPNDDLSELVKPKPVEMRVLVNSQSANMKPRVMTLSTTAQVPENIQPSEDNMKYWRMSLLS